ncbi:MAG: MarR family transcriptional regulator [Chloroflexota bacterium]
MTLLTERYAEQIAGVVSCFDRLVIMGTLPGVCYAEGMAKYLRLQGIRLFDYPRFAEPLREEVRANAERLAAEHGLTIEFVRSAGAFRKEDRVQAVLAERGTAPGLVHIFSAMEPCTAFTPWHDKARGTTTLRYKDGKCLHYYFYFLDAEFGLCYLRVPTWAPFRLQFYCNGHHWLAGQLRQAGIAAEPLDHTFRTLADPTQAQTLADGFPVERLHQFLDAAAARYCPVLARFAVTYHWSLMQVEYATDLIFRRQADLRPLYDSLVRTAIHAVKADQVATFLGHKLTGNFQDELGNDFHTRIEGTRLKHHMGPVSIKLYDKQALVLRIETTVNDVSFFRHHRKVEHRNGTTETKLAPMRKTIDSLAPLRERLLAANRRYLAFLSALTDPSAGSRQAERLAEPVRTDDRSYRGFNLLSADDLALFVALTRGEWQISGLRNATLRRLLPGRSGAQVSRLLKRLHLHGLIRKIGRTYKYYLTPTGQRVILTALKVRELVVVPSLAGLLPAA